MKRILTLILALCLLISCAACFGGCSSESSGDWPVAIGDLTISKEPQNIVVLNDVFADIISAIGYDVKMVGRSTDCDQDFLHIVPTVGTAAAPDIGAIADAQADLVITDSTLANGAKETIESNGAQVLILDVPADSEALKALYITLGTALGGRTTGSEKGKSGYTDLLDMLSTMNTATSNVVQTVAYLYLDGSNQLCTFVKDTLPYTFFNYNGNSNVFANQTESVVNLEELRIGSPNYIFYDSDEVLTALTADENLNRLHALKNNRTLKISRRAFERYGASAEQAIYEMLSFIERDTKATPDEAAVAETSAPATQAPAAKEPETEAPASAEEEQDENVITFSAQDAGE